MICPVNFVKDTGVLSSLGDEFMTLRNRTEALESNNDRKSIIEYLSCMRNRSALADKLINTIMLNSSVIGFMNKQLEDARDIGCVTCLFVTYTYKKRISVGANYAPDRATMVKYIESMGIINDNHRKYILNGIDSGKSVCVVRALGTVRVVYGNESFGKDSHL